MERKGVKVVRQEPGEGLAFCQEDVVNLIIWGGMRKTVQVERTSELNRRKCRAIAVQGRMKGVVL